ncbi:uncharacterized protein CMC5_020140 [Chondromyces crocatus]|uniref:Secreted protein n=2 Tax=Chondromyces crocatus TaxID=52 RepID=A0A0K1EAF9_CHOCO|nr:uncharacterized protein CMC5_020140 [Chondromyces crocatus]
MNKLKALLLMTMLGTLPAACGGAAASYCDLVCDCSGCNDNQYDECLTNTQAALDKAAIYDCGDEWDDLEECVFDEYSCRRGDFSLAVCFRELAEAEVCVHDRSDGMARLFSEYPIGF